MVDIYKGTKADKNTKQTLKEDAANVKGFIPGTAGFMDTFGPSVNKTFSQSTVFGRELTKDNLLGEQQRKANAAGVDINYRKTLDDDLIRTIQSQHPEYGLLTSTEIEDELINRHNKTLDIYNKASERASFGGKIGSLVGSMAGFVKDPLNAASFLVGGSAIQGAKFATNFVRVGAVEGVINTALEGVQKKGEVELREKLGEDVSAGQIAGELGIAAGAGFVLGGTIGASLAKLPGAANRASEVTRTFADKVTTLRKEVDSGNISLNPEQADNLSMAEELVDVAATTPDGMSQATHSQQYGLAAKQFEEGNNIKVSKDDTLSHIDIENDVPQPKDSDGFFEDSIIKDELQQDNLIRDVKESLEIEDIDFPEFNTNGELVTRSGKEIMEDLDKQSKEIDDLISCMNRSGE